MVARTYPPNYAYGFVLSTIILSFSIILIILYRRATKLTSKYVTVTGKAPRPKTIDLGRWKYVVTVIVLVFLAFMSYSPAVLAVIESLTPFASAYGPETLTRLTLKNYATVISDARFAGIVSNTVFMAIIAAVACLLLALVVGYLAVRTKGKSGAVLHVASTFPLALPGAVIGTSLLWTFATTPIYGTMWILIFGLIIKNLPFGIALSVQGMYQVGYELEECSRMCGASWVGTFRRIMVPLLRASIFSSLFYLLIRSLGELEVVLLLRGTESEVLSTWLYTEWATGSARLASAMAVIIMIVNVALYLATRGAEHRGKGATAEAMKP
ncbi:MAG: ABC transporter permease subunit [Thaumarchaeota archaeon]|nr:ABC transporter permease subunit [Nitrososphaerota archaeon]